MPVNQSAVVAKLLEKHLGWLVEGELPRHIVSHAFTMANKGFHETTIVKSVGVQLEQYCPKCFVEDGSTETDSS